MGKNPFDELPVHRHTVDMPELLRKAGVADVGPPNDAPNPLPTESGDIRLYYYPTAGRGESIRMLLAEAGVRWENVMFQDPDEADILSSPETFLGAQKSERAQEFFAAARKCCGSLTTSVPMLEVDGKFYTQSGAIRRYIAHRIGLYPRDDDEAVAVVEEVIGNVDDLFAFPYVAFFKGETQEKFCGGEEVLPKHLGNLERMLEGKEYFAGSYSLADVVVYDALAHVYECAAPDCTKAFPNLSEFMKRVAKRPRLATYFASEEFGKKILLKPLKTE